MLSGKKTYLVAALAIAGAWLSYFTGAITIETAIGATLGALGLGTLRDGVTTEAKKAAAATESPEVTAARETLRKAGIAVALLFGIGISAGCAVISPPAEDVTAIKSVSARLPAILESDQKVYRDTIEAFAKSLRKHAIGWARERADFELFSEGAFIDHAGRPFPPRPEVAKNINAERTGQILARLAQDEAEAEAAIQDLYDAGMSHGVHGDLKLITDLLTQYVFARMSRDEVQAQIAQQAHDLVYRKKE